MGRCRVQFLHEGNLHIDFGGGALAFTSNIKDSIYNTQDMATAPCAGEICYTHKNTETHR